MDQEQPVIIKDCVRVVLGRQTSTSPIPAMDLTPYAAASYGVSRQHAIVMNMLDSYTIRDLGSTNGTWVNGRRLEPGKPCPLSSGSQVRLGQFMLYTYFRLRSVPEDIVLLYEEARGSALLRPSLTPDYLIDVVYPYLQALADIQHVLDDARGQFQSQICVNTISASRHESPIGVSLSGAGDAVRVAQDWVQPWRQENTGLSTTPLPASNGGETAHQEHLNLTRSGLADVLAGSTALWSSTAAHLIQESQAAPASPQPLQADLTATMERLAQAILRQYLPDAAEPDRQTYLVALASPLRILAASRLQVYAKKEARAAA